MGFFFSWLFFSFFLFFILVFSAEQSFCVAFSVFLHLFVLFLFLTLSIYMTQWYKCMITNKRRILSGGSVPFSLFVSHMYIESRMLKWAKITLVKPSTLCWGPLSKVGYDSKNGRKLKKNKNKLVLVPSMMEIGGPAQENSHGNLDVRWVNIRLFYLSKNLKMSYLIEGGEN